jgi:hypothetical protein
MNRGLLETRKYFIGLLPGDLQVQRVSTEINLVAPANLASGSDGYPAKRIWIVPQLEYALADQMRKVNVARHAIGVPQTQSISGQWLRMYQFQHSYGLLISPQRQTKASRSARNDRVQPAATSKRNHTARPERGSVATLSWAVNTVVSNPKSRFIVP